MQGFFRLLLNLFQVIGSTPATTRRIKNNPLVAYSSLPLRTKISYFYGIIIVGQFELRDTGGVYRIQAPLCRYSSFRGENNVLRIKEISLTAFSLKVSAQWELKTASLVCFIPATTQLVKNNQLILKKVK